MSDLLIPEQLEELVIEPLVTSIIEIGCRVVVEALVPVVQLERFEVPSQVDSAPGQ